MKHCFPFLSILFCACALSTAASAKEELIATGWVQARGEVMIYFRKEDVGHLFDGSCMSGKMSGHNPAMPKKYQNQHVRVYGVLLSWAELYDRLKRFGENSGVENYCASADIALITRPERIAP
jgi:hypothetical protein